MSTPSSAGRQNAVEEEARSNFVSGEQRGEMGLFARRKADCLHQPKAAREPRAEACEACGSTFNVHVCSECGCVGCCGSQRGPHWAGEQVPMPARSSRTKTSRRRGCLASSPRRVYFRQDGDGGETVYKNTVGMAVPEGSRDVVTFVFMLAM